MARRRTMNRKRYSTRRSIDSVGSGHLDPDTDLVDEEQTFWWNHLQENTPPPGSLIYNTNETARHLSVNSQVESNRGSSVGSEWWKNLTHSDSDHAASTSRGRNLSAEIVKTYVVQTSESPTSESEKEIDLRKKKVYLKASNNRKSINNAFSSALDDAEDIPLKLRIQANNSDLRSDSAREVSQERLQDDEEDQEDNNLSLTRIILKSKPTISRRRRDDNTKDQNLFEDILTQDSVLNGSTARESIALEKESSKRLMHQSIDTSHSKIGTNIETRQSTILSDGEETNSDKEVDSGMQTIQRNSTSTRAETSSKAVSQLAVQSSNRISIKEGKKTVDTQKSLGKSQNYRDTSNKKASKDISSKLLRRIDDFFKVKQTSTTTDKHAQESQIFNAEKMEKINAELERIKNREMAAMKLNTIDKKESTLKAKNVKSTILKQATKKKKKKPLANPAKTVDKAFLVNGKVYRAPRLPRPKHWVTDRFYKFLWKCMEPKYKFSTRVKSEKFVQEFAKIVSLIERRKNYKNYNLELEALMKEMARLKIINTRNDFYHFCQDFMPYEFRVKVVPMLMPGNKMNIPYDPEKLHIPLLD